MIVSMFSGLTLSALTPTAAIDLIVGYAANDDAHSLLISDLTDAGVTGTDSNNLAAYKTAIAAAIGSAVDSQAELQGLVNAVNLAEAITVINLRASHANTTTAAELATAGVSGAVVVNNSQYSAAILGAVSLSLDTTAKIQTLVSSVNTNQATLAINTIKAYALNNNAAGLTTDFLTQAGVVGINAANLARYQAAIVALADDATLLDSTPKIQSLVSTVNSAVAAEKEAAAIAKIKVAASNDDATAITDQDLLDAGLIADSVKVANMGTHNATIANSTGYRGVIERGIPSDVDSTSKLQTIVNVVNAAIVATETSFNNALTAIKADAANDDASSLTITVINNWRISKSS